jgi:hypothetical protein
MNIVPYQLPESGEWLVAYNVHAMEPNGIRGTREHPAERVIVPQLVWSGKGWAPGRFYGLKFPSREAVVEFIDALRDELEQALPN